MSCRYVVIDESGDLGIHGTPYFVIVLIVVDDPKVLKRIVKKTRQKKLKKHIRHMSELKANKCDRTTREFLLRKVSKADCDIFAVVVEKAKIMPYLFEVKDRLYNFFCKILLNEIDVNSTSLRIIIDKKHTNTLLRKNFNGYIQRELSIRKHLSVEITHADSRSYTEIQVVDFVAWAIARKFNHGDDKYYRIIEDKIKNRERMKIWE